ncbi:lytic murein transglycosylase [Rhodomicrobium sp. Az07]|uniref:lytic murein transglycosylase n=1 Tax=Rhodomicrobium sp. Az07 TaxID=2839034 RepID=UPI001BE7661E|nr:lytic murein transglycosylase [Rhodomicrobium sp. Az07]MBT3072098.1 lytic murein transglycosylase [Rhodomicrobium sp. Az07]
MAMMFSRRAVLQGALVTLVSGACGSSAVAPSAFAQSARMPFSRWVDAFGARARSRGISGATYARVMGSLKPDTSVYALDKAQPEFKEEVWQYLNRRVSDWRIGIGMERAREYAPLLEKLERTYGVDRHVMLGLWGMESAFGDVVNNPKHMRPVFPALAALAWGEPRRRAYWERELLNALVIVDRGWSTPEEMVGSWAGAMGHTQWMPEVWLNVGVDFDGDGRISPFGPPDDALAGTAQYIAKRGKYRRGEGWGYEVRLPEGRGGAGGWKSIAAWQGRGVTRANGKPFPRPDERARLWQPVARGPAFLLTRNFDAIKSYNPANTYALAIAHLGDRLKGEGPFVQQFPGGERAPTLAEVQELQQRLTASGFNTGGTDGRVGKDTMKAIRDFQLKVGMRPADGYAGLKVLARLRASGV